MTPSESGRQWLMVAAVLCAVVLTGLRAWEFVDARANAHPKDSTPPIPVAGWERFARGGHRLGPDDAPVTIVVFADFECPYCATLATATLPQIRARYPTKVAVVYRHFPLRQHRFAYPAARAAECAGRQQRFDAYHDQLFTRQDSLGLLTFTELAQDAGVPDLRAFSTCASATGPVESIELDLRAARELGAYATPTVVIDGMMYSGTLSVPTLDSLVKAVLRKSRGD
jgi:protein-disulfide isomerase